MERGRYQRAESGLLLPCKSADAGADAGEVQMFTRRVDPAVCSCHDICLQEYLRAVGSRAHSSYRYA